jgi:hypothetical protein
MDGCTKVLGTFCFRGHKVTTSAGSWVETSSTLVYRAQVTSAAASRVQAVRTVSFARVDIFLFTELFSHHGASCTYSHVFRKTIVIKNGKTMHECEG